MATEPNGPVPWWRYLEAVGIFVAIVAAMWTIYHTQLQATSLAKQTEYITRPAELHLVLDFYKERGGNEPPEIRNPINLTIVNTGAQLGIVSRVVVNYSEVDRMVDGKREKYADEDAVSFPVKVIPPSGWVTQPITLHEPLIINDTFLGGKFKTEGGLHRVQYIIKILNESSTQPIIVSDWFIINWEESVNGRVGFCNNWATGGNASLCSRYLPPNRK